MSYSPGELQKAIAEARAQAPPRGFTESVEILVALKDLDLKNPTNRFSLETAVPNMIKKARVALFADGDLAVRAEQAGLRVITRDEMDTISKNPKDLKKLAREFDFFLATPPMMPQVGKLFGKFLGPLGKMPRPIPPTADIESIVGRYDRTIRLRVRSNPCINARIGTLNNSDKELVENAEMVLSAISQKLPRAQTQISKIAFKTTMGPTVKIS